MIYKKYVLVGLFLIVTISQVSATPLYSGDQPFNTGSYKVNVGDRQTFTLVDYLAKGSTSYYNLTWKDGTTTNVGKGSTWVIEVCDNTTAPIKTKWIYGNHADNCYDDAYPIIYKVANKSYYENLVTNPLDQNQTSTSYNLTLYYTLTNNIITQYSNASILNQSTNFEYISYDITTGWMTEWYSKEVYTNGDIFIIHLKNVVSIDTSVEPSDSSNGYISSTVGGSTSGFDNVSVLSFLFITAPIILFKRKKFV